LIAWCAVSVLVQFPGVLVDFSKVRMAYAHQVQAGPYENRMHTWTASPLVLNARAAASAVPAALRQLAGLQPRPAIREAGGEDPRGFSQQFAFGLDFWWVSLFYLGVISGPTSIAIGVLLALTTLVTGCALRAALGREDAEARALRLSGHP